MDMDSLCAEIQAQLNLDEGSLTWSNGFPLDFPGKLTDLKNQQWYLVTKQGVAIGIKNPNLSKVEKIRYSLLLHGIITDIYIGFHRLFPDVPPIKDDIKLSVCATSIYNADFDVVGRKNCNCPFTILEDELSDGSTDAPPVIFTTACVDEMLGSDKEDKMEVDDGGEAVLNNSKPASDSASVADSDSFHSTK